MTAWDKAYDVAWRILHHGDRADWDKRFPNRPDWQSAVELIAKAIREGG